MWRISLAAAALFGAAVPAYTASRTSTCNVVDYGAKADGRSNDVAAIQKAIDACARSGGGTVYFPTGNYLSGTIRLKSNIMLELSPGATLWGSREMADYNPPHLIYAENAENIGISGTGAINGNGDAFWNKDFTPKSNRPHSLIELLRCRGIHISGVRIRNTPMFGIHPVECDGASIHGISMISDMRGPNTDGIDPDCSRNIAISDSYIETGDDAICLKSHDKPVENITVTNCTLVSDDSALKVGTGTRSPIRNCRFSNCVITGTRYGISFFVKDGGLIEGLSFSNIHIDTSIEHFNRRTNSTREWTEYPIFIDVEKRTPESPVSRVRDISFSDIQIRSKGRVVIEGMPSNPIENLSFRNLTMRITGFEELAELRKPRGVRGMEPAPRDQDYSATPAALVFANVRGLRLRDIQVIWEAVSKPQSRHSIYAAAVEDLFLAGFTGSAPRAGLAPIGLDAVRHAFVTECRTAQDTLYFIGTRNMSDREVFLVGNDLRGVTPVAGGVVYEHPLK